MRKILASCTAMVLILGGMLVNAPVALAEDFECRGTVGAVTVVGNLIVPDDATCVLAGTTVQGGIVVKSRANLDATNVTATGGVQGESPASVLIRDSRFGNSISLRKAEDVNNPDAGKIGISGTNVNGDIQLEENREPISLRGNEIIGSIQANKNTGGLEITGNQIGNGLQCQDNNPPPVGGGNVAKQKQGQCQFL
jgi:hypothetical protein